MEIEKGDFIIYSLSNGYKDSYREGLIKDVTPDNKLVKIKKEDGENKWYNIEEEIVIHSRRTATIKDQIQKLDAGVIFMIAMALIVTIFGIVVFISVLTR